jgi:ATP-dependent DNA helicase DinG
MTTPEQLALARVTGAMDAAEERVGQQQMVDAVASAIADERHLIVQAGTGTGKTLGYLVPALIAGKRVIVATATKALQDQLATKDLPFLEANLGQPFEWAVLKGRSNYVCLQRLRELSKPGGPADGGGQLELEELAATTKVEVRRLATWAGDTPTGDRADLDWNPSEKAWQAVSVGADECPGAKRCSMGDSCFAEMARMRAQAADVTVVNMHLYGLNVAAGGAILPEHDLLIVDEAHQLEDIMSDTVGVDLSPGRFTNAAAVVKRIIDDPAVIAAIADAASLLREPLSRRLGERLPWPLPAEVAEVLITCRGRLDAAQTALRAIDTNVDEAKQKVVRAQQVCTRLMEHIDQALADRDGYVAFVSGGPEYPHLEVAPLDVGPVLFNGIWAQRTAVLCSATIPTSLSTRVGLPDGGFEQIDVGSPFDYEHHGRLYCALHLPDPRSPQYAAATHDELVALITAAGGRTLALFTSYKAMDIAAEAVRGKLLARGLPITVMTQRDLPKMALVEAFSNDESSCLFATSGFFQGVDIPGRTLSLVTIDRIPFPRPDDPLLSARRERLGARAFGEIDVPRASMLLAQATGRLIRTAADRGVVAVFDPRLGKANYRWDIVRALPPMRRTRHRADAEAFLREITAEA